MRQLLVLAVVGAVAAGCGQAAAPAPATDLSAATTDRSLAAAIVDHVGGRPTEAAPLFDRRDERRGADVSYQGRPGQEAGGLDVSVVVERKPGPAPTCGDHDDCETTRDGDRDVLLAWDEATPGEDEGRWFVRTRLGSMVVTLRAYGPLIDGDPRSGRLADLTDDLRAVVADPAVGFSTSPEYVGAGRAIPGVV